jgi:hypothetical protein
MAVAEDTTIAWFAAHARQLGAVRAAFASEQNGRFDIWTVLYAPDQAAEDQLFDLQRAVEQQNPDYSFDFGLIYRSSAEPLDADTWVQRGWRVLFDRASR